MSYVKVRPYVADRLGVTADRYRFADGNVLIWDKELRMIDNGWAFHPAETVARIGGLLMDPYATRDEQVRSAAECTPLPLPTDPAWALPEEEVAEETVIEEEAAAEEAALEEAMEEILEASPEKKAIVEEIIGETEDDADGDDSGEGGGS